MYTNQVTVNFERNIIYVPSVNLMPGADIKEGIKQFQQPVQQVKLVLAELAMQCPSWIKRSKIKSILLPNNC